MRLGVVDLGTNSAHLLVGLLERDGRFQQVCHEHHLVRLGKGGLVSNHLTPSAMRRVMSVLRRYRRLLIRHRVEHIEVVATSAIREARNGAPFIRRIRREAGLPLRVIRGEEEARLIALGVLRGRRPRRPIAILAVGGGSTQAICTDRGGVRYAVSVPLGGSRLAQRFIRHDPPRAAEISALRRYVRRMWAPVIHTMRRHRWRQTFGSSAAIAHLAMASSWPVNRHLAEHPKRFRLTFQRLQRLTEWLSTSTAAERKRRPGLDARRQEQATSSAFVVLEWMAGCGISTMRFAPGSLREGLVVDVLRRRLSNPGRSDASVRFLHTP